MELSFGVAIEKKQVKVAKKPHDSLCISAFNQMLFCLGKLRVEIALAATMSVFGPS